MIELQLLKRFCSNKEDFLSYKTYFDDILPNVERELKLIYSLIGEYYDKYSENIAITKDELFTYYKYVYPVSKNEVVIRELIFDLFTIEIPDTLIQDLLQQLKERYFATKIVNKLLPVVEGTKYGVFPTLKSDIDQFTSTQSVAQDNSMQPCKLSIKDLVNKTITRDGLFWHINGVSDILGSIPLKSLGAVFGYVNASKTSFCVSACYNFAEQLINTDDLIIYAGNEEPAERLYLRFTQALTKMSSPEIEEFPEKAEELMEKSAMKNIMIYDSIINIDQVEYLLDKYSPRVIVVDQGTKVAIKSNEKDVVKIQHLYNQYRNFVNQYNTSMIVVSQGDAKTANKKWLALQDMYSSKVAIQGELDYAIGIGFLSDDPAKKRLRYINIPKNKGPMGKCISNFNEEICSWKEV